LDSTAFPYNFKEIKKIYPFTSLDLLSFLSKLGFEKEKALE
jgi:hypothetical protein